MASVSIFAFIDKEGIVTETQKYCHEMVVINKHSACDPDKGPAFKYAQVLGISHDTLKKKEDKIYEFQEKHRHK